MALSQVPGKFGAASYVPAHLSRAGLWHFSQAQTGGPAQKGLCLCFLVPEDQIRVRGCSGPILGVVEEATQIC